MWEPSKVADSAARKALAGAVDGLEVSYTSASQVTVGAGACRDSANTLTIELASATVADLTVSGAGGLDTGSEAADTWYQVLVIAGTAGVSTLLHAGTGDPTLPSGYTHWRRVGWVRNDAAGDLLAFAAAGSGRRRRYRWLEDYTNLRALSGGTATTWTTVDCSAFVPPDCRWGHLWRFAASTQILVSHDGSCCTGGNAPAGAAFVDLQRLSASQEVEYKNSAASASYIDVYGWEDVL